MRSSAKNISLTPVDDLFSTEESRSNTNRERVVELPLSELHPFRNHPFKVVDDEKMQDTAQSIREHGVLVPAIVRPREEGGYEIVAGHRRHFASQIAGLDTMPAIVRDLDDDAATIIMVDSNLQRETLLPSERAWAYKMKLDAMKRQGKRTDLTCGQVGHKSEKSVMRVAEQAGESVKQLQRFIRLTELIPPLLDMVDERKIAFNPAVELSYLKPEEQVELLDAMDSEQATPSLSQAQRLKKFSQEGHLSIDVMRAIMSEEKKSELDQVTLTSEKLHRYFPKSYTPPTDGTGDPETAGRLVQSSPALPGEITPSRLCDGRFFIPRKKGGMKCGCFQDRENEGLHRHVQSSSEKQEPDIESQGPNEPAAFAAG